MTWRAIRDDTTSQEELGDVLLLLSHSLLEETGERVALVLLTAQIVIEAGLRKRQILPGDCQHVKQNSFLLQGSLTTILSIVDHPLKPIL